GARYQSFSGSLRFLSSAFFLANRQVCRFFSLARSASSNRCASLRSMGFSVAAAPVLGCGSFLPCSGAAGSCCCFGSPCCCCPVARSCGGDGCSRLRGSSPFCASGFCSPPCRGSWSGLGWPASALGPDRTRAGRPPDHLRLRERCRAPRRHPPAGTAARWRCGPIRAPARRCPAAPPASPPSRRARARRRAARARAQSCHGPPAQRSFAQGGSRAEQGERRPGEPGILVVVLDRETRLEFALVNLLQLGEEFQDAEIRAAAREQGAVSTGGQLAQPGDIGAGEDGAALLVLLVA